MSESTTDYKNMKYTNNKSVFYRAVIENNKDPLKLNRVQVRILGIHPDDNEKIPTENLPWAEVIAPSLFGLNSGIGVSAVPNNGTYVWVFLERDDFNKPVIIGTIYGQSNEKEEGAFTDPDKVFPLDDRLKEPDTNRLARVENLENTIVQDKIINTAKGNITATGKIWNEPLPLNTNSSYPDNTVIETKSGHVIEIDDSEGNERIHIYHTTGSYIELLPDGRFVMKSSAEKFEIVTKDSKTVNLENKTETTNADYENKVSGYEARTVGGDFKEDIDGNQSITVGKNSSIDISNGLTITVGGSSNWTTSGSTNIKASIINLN